MSHVTRTPLLERSLRRYRSWNIPKIGLYLRSTFQIRVKVRKKMCACHRFGQICDREYLENILCSEPFRRDCRASSTPMYYENTWKHVRKTFQRRTKLHSDNQTMTSQHNDTLEEDDRLDDSLEEENLVITPFWISIRPTRPIRVLAHWDSGPFSRESDRVCPLKLNPLLLPLRSPSQFVPLPHSVCFRLIAVFRKVCVDQEVFLFVFGLIAGLILL